MKKRQTSTHFSREELQCRCCHKLKIHPDLLILLERIRTLVGAPIIVNSGYRCPKHNAEVGGKPKTRYSRGSTHMYGEAADIRQNRYSNDTFWSMVRRAYMEGRLPELGGLGRYNGRIHVDIYHPKRKRYKAPKGSPPEREWDSR